MPDVWKSSIFVPVPKHTKPEALNDFRPVALTSVVMKCLERLVLRRLIGQTSSLMDPNQFAYWPCRGVEDATSFLIRRVVEHLDGPGTYARILFMDLGSAFNTMHPSNLYQKLIDMGVDIQLANWILDYLRARTQQVRINTTLSSTAITNIGAPNVCSRMIMSMDFLY